MKYFENDKEYYKRLVDLIGIRAEGPPGTVLYVQDSNDQGNYNRHILENGFLRLRDDEVSIFSLYFKGVHLIESKNSSDFFNKNGFKINNEINWENAEVYNSIDEIIETKEELNNGDIFRILKHGIETLEEDNNNLYPKIDVYNSESENNSLKALFILQETLGDNEGWIVSVGDIKNNFPSEVYNDIYDLMLE